MRHPTWNSCNVELPPHVWLDPLGIDEHFPKGEAVTGVALSKNKSLSFNCKFVPFQRLAKAQQEIKVLKKMLVELEKMYRYDMRDYKDQSCDDCGGNLHTGHQRFCETEMKKRGKK